MFKLIRILPVHLFLALLSLGAVSNQALAGAVNLPNTFSSGTPAVAAEVNANFATVKTAVDDNDSRITALEETVAALQATIAALQNSLSSVETDSQLARTALQSRLSTVEGNSVLALDNNLVYTVDANGYPTAQFTGVNVQVVNGTGSTDGTPYGLGNLIVGYNPARTGGFSCSIGSATNPTDCTTAGGVWAVSYKRGSHNLVIGDRHNYSSYGGLVAGYSNTIKAAAASISGGSYNTVSGMLSSINGGSNNTASGGYSNISGGFQRSVSGQYDWRAGLLFETQ